MKEPVQPPLESRRAEGASSEEPRPLAVGLAERLGETRPGPVGQIAGILHALGPEPTKALVQEALTIHRGHGMLVENGTRKRTAGGIFFYLARQQMSAEAWQRIHPYHSRSQPKPFHRQPPKSAQPVPADQAQAAALPTPKPQPTPAPVPAPALTLDEMIELAKTLKEGPAMTTMIKLIGRPGQLKTSGKCVLFTLQSEKVPALPAGLPPVEPGTRYLVIVASKQWNKVAPALEADPEARFLIEGYPTHQKDFIAVEAQSCKLLSKQAPATLQGSDAAES